MPHNENLLLDQEQEQDAIMKTIRSAGKYKLVAEVIYSAFKYMQDNAGCSISEALFFGEKEWI